MTNKILLWPAVLLLVFLYPMITKAQTPKTNYDVLWKKVDSLYSKKGLTRSALDEVNKIYALAKKENLQPQVIKALTYKSALEQNLNEDGNIKSMQFWEKEIAQTNVPATKALLNSMAADKYNRYFQNNRWKFYNRTKTVDFKKDDPSTWTLEDLQKKTSDLYLASIKEEKLLQQTKLDVYDPILVKGNVRYLRPTLYDLLANRALEFFKTDERYVTKPAYNFEITQAAAFDPAADFIHRKFETKDTASLHYKALLIYQKLIAFHIDDQKPDALIDVDLQRIQFVKQYSIAEKTDQFYYNSSNHVAHQYESYPAAAQAWYLVAQWHANKAAGYAPTGDTTNRYEYIKTKEICEKIAQQQESSEGKANCANLLQQIQHPQFNLNTEKVNIPGQSFRTLVTYKNITQLTFRIVQLSENLKAQLKQRYDDSYWRQVTVAKAFRTWSQNLPDTKDYQSHKVEIKVDALPVGDYLIVASADGKFSLDKNPLAVQYFHVSNISYVNNDNEYFVLHRETGKPLQNAQVQVWENYYDYNSRGYVNKKGELLNTDSKGYFKLKDDTSKVNKSRRFEINYKEDHLFLDEATYSFNRYENEKDEDSAVYERDQAKVFLFTDRSIYRPGQTVYFKGIAITKDFKTRKPKIVSGVQSKLALYNANGEQIDSLVLTTNEFGSYSGKFVLPSSGLNGIFRLESDDIEGNVSFSVEEYKRPKFSVEYNKLTNAYRVNDSVTVKGNAKAYAGNNIDGAKVKYHVTRAARFIYPWLYSFKGGYPVSSGPMEIANGEVITSNDGSFIIRFKAIPDEHVSKSLEPVFDYAVVADVTDINGETRSGEIIVSAGYKAIQLQIDLAQNETLAIDSLKKISVTAKNFNNRETSAQVQLKLYKLQQPDRLIRERYWSEPDQFVMTYNEYVKLFPNDEYSNEGNKDTWSKGTAIAQVNDSANHDISIGQNALTAGWYMIEAVAKDKYGDSVKDVKYVLLHDNKSKQLPAKTYLTTSTDKTIVEPGEEAIVTIGTAANDVTLIQQTNKTAIKEKGAFQYNVLTLNNEKKYIVVSPTEEDRGGIGMIYFMVKNNRFYTSNNSILVPWRNKELSITYETWRDKLQPGSEEKWSIKITGNKKEKVAAEVLAGMYDASLDQFKPHAWEKPGVWPFNSLYANWNSRVNFLSIQSQEKYLYSDGNFSFEKNYDVLITPYYINVESKLAPPGVMLQGRVAGVDVKANNEVVVIGYGTQKKKDVTGAALSYVAVNEVAIQDTTAPNQQEQMASVQLRKNFNETAFFFPDLKTDAEGNIRFSFTMPEALTKWKFQALAHTKDLSFGYSTVDVVTQKELMIQPNAPRFLREGDKIELSAKVVNMSDKEMTGTVQLELLNASTMQPVDGWFQNIQPLQYFTVSAGQSAPMKFSVSIPYGYNNAVVYRFKAISGNLRDGEEMALPVVANSMLVTESMPLNLRNTNSKSFTFEKLLQSGKSETLQQHALTVEYTSNPAWYAVQSLPYLTDFPYECAEQTFNRYYANALAGMIANKAPKLKAIVEKWNATDSSALLSNLQKNEELKSVLLEETPWVLEAKNEAQQKKNIALLFDMVRMNAGLQTTYEKLKQLQSENGGFVWFKGGPDDRYITQYIASSIGHLKKLGALQQTKQDWNGISKNAVAYLDKRIADDYNELVKRKVDLKKNNLSYIAIQYLYMRSFYNDIAIPGSAMNAISYYRKQAQQYWLQQGVYAKGMIALALNRTGDKANAAAIIKSLQQNAIVNEEQGMYWKDVRSGYFWYEAPVETQSLMIEAFAEISGDTKTVNDLKTWLLKNKQTNNWKTTKATADACYALLLQGGDWLSETPAVKIKLGDKTISSTDSKSEAGTGYFKTTIDGAFVKPEMGNITVSVSGNANNTSSWGSVYWQYFERLENITSSATPLKLTKKLFVEKNSDRGPVLQPVNENDVLKVGDKIKVRIELRADRDMEYVHMKDMRASCMEPVNVISTYKWQDGLGYYESTKDASANFFFSYIRKGTYVFEYPLFVTHEGNFSNGVTTIQCMYAPEFTSHSDGVRVNVE
ncbi:alpha-2-macroglobulin family protein [Pinibacter soli]|uniref:Alpha-2-macroglobulin family protein n=1 Tax=Pinibacter soli TaxID=3044211 RepID=A0ABT6RIE9_9BACT|nr:alpha-2-macroglobulin family protein [Pinibacter soli]MDI3322303.1 alpha-2-macroglobulin family protein [Pinibacter soli]